MSNKESTLPIFEIAVKDHTAAVRGTFSEKNVQLLQEISERIAKVLTAGNKILFCGNGGSAADSQHIAAEFIGRFKRERKSLAALALTTDTSILTAIGNDYSYDLVFERQVDGIGASGDLLVALSTSGNSQNVVRAVKKAKEKGITTIGFTGKSGGALRSEVDIVFAADATKTPHIQEMHIMALHAVSEAAEALLFPT